MQSAVADEVRVLDPLMPKLERKLAKLEQDKKMPATQKADELKDLRETIRETKVRLRPGEDRRTGQDVSYSKWRSTYRGQGPAAIFL